MEQTEKKLAFPYRLQFFAEGDDNGGDNGDNGGGEDEQPTIEELQSRIAIAEAAAEAEKTARQKDKVALDKALKEVARLTKEARANKTEAEIEAENKRLEAERIQEELVELRDYRKRNEAKDRYLAQGMTPENASKAADAEVTGNMDALAEVQRQHTDALIKAKEVEWKKSRPDANVGAGGAWASMTREEIMAIEDDAERQKAIAANHEKFGF